MPLLWNEPPARGIGATVLAKDSPGRLTFEAVLVNEAPASGACAEDADAGAAVKLLGVSEPQSEEMRERTEGAEFCLAEDTDPALLCRLATGVEEVCDGAGAELEVKDTPGSASGVAEGLGTAGICGGRFEAGGGGGGGLLVGSGGVETSRPAPTTEGDIESVGAVSGADALASGASASKRAFSASEPGAAADASAGAGAVVSGMSSGALGAEGLN